MSGTAGGRSGHRRRLLGGLAAGATFVALALTAGAAWDGQQTVVLGDSFSSTFQGEAGAEMHRYDFYAPAGTSLKAKVKVAKGATLAPAWQVFTIAGDMVDLGSANTGTQIKNYKFAEGGAYYMQLTATSGSGRYDVSTSGSKLPTKYGDKAATDGFSFEAVAGSALSAKIKGAETGFTGLEGPFGPVVIGAGEGGVAQVKNLVLPYSGHYELLFTGTGSVSVKLKAPAKMSWFFDAVESTRGTASLAQGEWLQSGHADFLAEPFRHWDGEGEIPTTCAACHSSTGYQDFVGADGTPSNVLGTPANTTDNAHEVGTTIDCNACHNTATPGLSVVQFPSGAIVEGLGNEARCMQCHQGRESKVSVDANIDGANVPDDDTESAAIRFRNVHYFAAGASLMGADAHGAYEYDGKIYNHRFPHVQSTNVCQKCHNQHTLEIRYERCAECHVEGANPALHSTPDWVFDIRFYSSLSDYDGDGNTTEGIYYEVHGLGDKLLAAMKAYANDRGAPITYDGGSYPYWYNADAAGNPTTSYNHWTARLVRAAYNYQYFQKDPGLFAHNAKYAIEFLYDSIESFYDVDPAFAPGFTLLHRNDTGHFDNTSEAFRHWDNTGMVSSSCAKCHSPGGFAFAARYGIPPIESYPVGDGFACEQCHEPDAFTQPDAPRIYVASVTFPSGVTIDNDPDAPDDSFLCMTCHQGRESKATVDDDIAAGKWSFNNVHYLAAGPSLYGHDALVGYEYDDDSAIGAQTYVGKWGHFSQANGGNQADSQCAFCHLSDHSFLPKANVGNNCGCHGNPADIESIRLNRGTDYNGNGSSSEKLKDEVQTFGDRLLLAMQDYALRTGKPALVYNGDSHPYFFKATGGSYTDWDAPLMKASFNFQFWAKEPGAWAHNTHYVLELLYDSINDLQTASPLDGDTDQLTTPTTLTRPNGY